MAPRRFTVPATVPDEEPIEFELAYTVDGNEKVEVFRARRRVRGTTMLRVNDGQVLEFFDEALIDDDRPAFVKLVDDPAIAVDINLLADIAEFIASEISNRPTKPSRRS